MFSIAILITSHNRKNKTLRCLNALFGQLGLNIFFEIDVFLVDDGCTDGTPEIVAKLFPTVNIIKGDGKLFWNRGMYLAWLNAARKKDFDFYLWLNDDVFLFKNAIINSLNSNYYDSVVIGTTVSEINNRPTYGGFSFESNTIINPNGFFQECFLINGNFVLVPHKVFQKLGMLDPIFHHSFGDFDYYYRGLKQGIKFYVSPDFVGICENHLSENIGHVPNWCSVNIPLFKRLKYLYQPQTGCVPTQLFLYKKRHFGFFQAVLHFFFIHIKCAIPLIFNKIGEFRKNSNS